MEMGAARVSKFWIVIVVVIIIMPGYINIVVYLEWVDSIDTSHVSSLQRSGETLLGVWS